VKHAPIPATLLNAGDGRSPAGKLGNIVTLKAGTDRSVTVQATGAKLRKPKVSR
jgi:hypothetical protein